MRHAADEGRALADELSSPEDAINFAITNEVRARLALAEHDAAGAERWARSAVEQAFRTDFVGVHAEAKLGLAHVLQAVGQTGLARSEAGEALSLFATKGDQSGSDAARSLLEQL